MSLDNQNFQEKTRWISYYNNVQTDNQALGTFLQNWNDSRNGSELPGWRSIIRGGGNATTDYACTFRRYLPANISVFCSANNIISGKQRRDYLTGRPDLGWGLVGSPTGLSSSQADRSAREQFLSRYRTRRTQFQSGVFLGELKKTVQMIRNPAQALRQAIDRYRGSSKERLRRKKYDRRLIQDSWLEFVFGVKPLIGDVEDALRLATASPLRVFQQLSGRGTQVTSIGQTTETLGTGLALFLYVSKISAYTSVQYKGAISVENSPPSFPEQCGLSWSNVLPTAWELAPYSFLVDYFANVGNVIDGVSTGPIRLAWGCKNLWKITSQEINVLGLDHQRLKSNFGTSWEDFNGYATGGGVVGQRSTYNRSGVDQVSLSLRDLRFKLPGSGTKWLNIAALVDYRKIDNDFLRALP